MLRRISERSIQRKRLRSGKWKSEGESKGTTPMELQKRYKMLLAVSKSVLVASVQ